jgi:hypothetical protein
MKGPISKNVPKHCLIFFRCDTLYARSKTPQVDRRELQLLNKQKKSRQNDVDVLFVRKNRMQIKNPHHRSESHNK